MPKMKTRKGAAKRLKMTASGKAKAYGAFTSHLMSSKSSKRRRKLRQGGIINNKAVTEKIKAMLGN